MIQNHDRVDHIDVVTLLAAIKRRLGVPKRGVEKYRPAVTAALALFCDTADWHYGLYLDWFWDGPVVLEVLETGTLAGIIIEKGVPTPEAMVEWVESYGWNVKPASVVKLLQERRT